jgi:hypothetical protein
MADRSALVPDTTPAPKIGVPGAPPIAGLYAAFQQTQLRVFAAATDDLFLITAAIAVIGVLGALLLRSDLASKLAGRGLPPTTQEPSSRPEAAGSATVDTREPVSEQAPAASRPAATAH